MCGEDSRSSPDDLAAILGARRPERVVPGRLFECLRARVDLLLSHGVETARAVDDFYSEHAVLIDDLVLTAELKSDLDTSRDQLEEAVPR